MITFYPPLGLKCELLKGFFCVWWELSAPTHHFPEKLKTLNLEIHVICHILWNRPQHRSHCGRDTTDMCRLKGMINKLLGKQDKKETRKIIKADKTRKRKTAFWRFKVSQQCLELFHWKIPVLFYSTKLSKFELRKIIWNPSFAKTFSSWWFLCQRKHCAVCNDKKISTWGYNFPLFCMRNFQRRWSCWLFPSSN